ncbi:MAG: hypothetical protein CHACPFDD_00477 [Phycisphaerae bacterium]|nr:hypothetical protein [Phycisphaerae bacterium]
MPFRDLWTRNASEANHMLSKPPFSTCPSCDYSLAGLPAAHTCPECGHAYGPATRIWRCRQHWRRRVLALFAGLVAVAAVVRVHDALRGGRSLSVRQRVAISSVGLAAAAVGVWMARTLRGDSALVAIGPAGLLVKSNGAARVLAWTDVRGVSVLLGVPRIETARRFAPIELAWIFASRREIEEFRACVEAGLRERRIAR